MLYIISVIIFFELSKIGLDIFSSSRRAISLELGFLFDLSMWGLFPILGYALDNNNRKMSFIAIVLILPSIFIGTRLFFVVAIVIYFIFKFKNATKLSLTSFSPKSFLKI